MGRSSGASLRLLELCHRDLAIDRLGVEFDLPPAFRPFSISGSPARNTIVMASMSRFLIGPWLMVALPCASSTLVAVPLTDWAAARRETHFAWSCRARDMPIGSPGMEMSGAMPDPYETVLVSVDGRTISYAKH